MTQIQPFNHAELRGARPRVFLQFHFRSGHRLARDPFRRRLLPHPFAPTGLQRFPSPDVPRERLLDDSILDAVKRNHADASSHLHERERAVQAALQTLELVVHRHSQCLKRLRRGVDLSETAAFRAADDFRELSRRGDGTPLPFAHDGPGDATRSLFFAEAPENIRKGGFVEAVDEIAGGRTAAPVHSHIERAFVEETEPSLRCVHLVRGHTQVEYDSIHPLDIPAGCDSNHVCKVSVLQKAR